MACFHKTGGHAELMERLKILHRNDMPEGPRCLRCTLVMLSGPVAVELLAVLIADRTCSSVNGLNSWSILCFL